MFDKYTCTNNDHANTHKKMKTSSLLNFSVTSGSFSNLYKFLFTREKCLKSTSRCTCKPDT